MFGRRPDGRRVKGIDPIVAITPYVMPMRCDAQVFLKHRADMEILSRYIRKQKIEKGEKFSNKSLVNKNTDFYMTLETLRYEKTLNATQKYLLSKYENKVEVLRRNLFDPQSIWYPQTQYAIFRNMNGWTLAAKGATNGESHNHNDVGSFMLYIDHIPVFVDPGVGTYTADTFGGEERRYSIWTMRSDWHNIPIINGRLQLPGEEYASEGNVCNVSKNQFSTHIQGAYGPQCACSDWQRSYSLNAASLSVKDRYVLKDRLAADVINFVVKGDVIPEGDGSLSIRATSHDGSREIVVRMSYPPSLSATLEQHDCSYDSKMKRSWGDHLTRITLTSAADAPPSGEYEYIIKLQ